MSDIIKAPAFAVTPADDEQTIAYRRGHELGQQLVAAVRTGPASQHLVSLTLGNALRELPHAAVTGFGDALQVELARGGR